MITDDEIMRLYELADPAHDDDVARTDDAAGYLDALRQRSYDMQLIDTTETPTEAPRDNRWVFAAIAAAIVLIVTGALILARDGGDEVPATPPTTVIPVAPTTAAEQAAGQSVEEAIALVRAHYDAANAYDAELARSFLADGVIVDGENWGPEKFRLGIEFAAAIDEKALLGDCTPVAGQGPGITIRCEFQYQGMRSGELGLGPFGDNSTDVVVVDGKITSIGSMSDFSENGFEEQMWDPFRAWMDANHPGDVAVMFADIGTEKSTATEESIQLWDQRSREYVELRLTAERVAAQFLEAFGAFDAEAAGSHLADGASTEQIVTEDVQDYTQAIALYQAWGYEQQLGSCQQVDATATGLQVRCPFTYHLLGSREMGLGPFEDSYFSVAVDNETGMITDVVNTWSGDDFTREVGDPFTNWVTTTYPDAEATMSVDGGPALTPESLALWEQYRHEYVQHVLGDTPTPTAA